MADQPSYYDKDLGYLRFSPPRQNIDEYLVWDEEYQAYFAPGEYPETIEKESFEDFCARIDQICREMGPPRLIYVDDLLAGSEFDVPPECRKSLSAPMNKRDLLSGLDDEKKSMKRDRQRSLFDEADDDDEDGEFSDDAVE